MSPPDEDKASRLVEHYETLVELEVAAHLREFDGWLVLSAGEIRDGRWWAEYEQLDSTGLNTD
jgi:hypothetical protein